MKTNFNLQKLASVILLVGLMTFASLVSNGQNLSFSITIKSYNGAHESCYGANDAQITINAVGGAGGYQYSIDNGQTFSSNNVFSNLRTGTNYKIVVKDKKGNKADALSPWLNKISNAVTFNTRNTTKATCASASDGEISVGAYGGTGQISFSIDNGATFQASGTFPNLRAGNYTIIAKDLNGCTAATTLTVTAGAGVSVKSYFQQDYNCEGWGQGKISFGGQGGKQPYQYFIDGVPSSNEESGLKPGKHMLTVTDAVGCSGSMEITIEAPHTAILTGDVVVAPNASFTLKVTITDNTATKNSLYTITGKDDMGRSYSFPDLKVGVNQSTFAVPESTVFTLLTVERQDIKCKGFASGTATITVKEEYIWKGGSSDWHKTSNWSPAKLPTATGDVKIPRTKNNPVITGEALAKNISIEANAGLQINGILKLGGAITSASPNTINASQGTIEMNGSIPQQLSGDVFTDNALYNLRLANTVDLKSELNIFGQLSFVAKTGNTLSPTFSFNTNDYLTLKSNASGTASVGKVENENRITGNVTVENYFPARKGWKFISVATKPNQTINAAWQEGQPAGNTTSIKGYGIQLTGTPANWKEQGFDAQSPSPAIKTHNTETNLWVGVTSTLVPFNHPSNAYMTFVRGDRSANTVTSAETPTVLRSKGELKTGAQDIINVPENKFVAVGNPFPSPIDINKITTTGGKMNFYIWDPNLGNSYGSYQTFLHLYDDVWTIVPGGGSYNFKNGDLIPGGQAIIPAGMAFFVYNAGTLKLTEDCKANPSVQLGGFRQSNDAGGNADRLKVTLFSKAAAQELLVDGTIQLFASDFNNDIDEDDAIKSANTTENLSIKSAGKLLAIERKAFGDRSDTTVLNMTGMSYTTYRFNIDFTQEAEDRDAVLIDKFTNSRTVIRNGQSTSYEFAVANKAGSNAANRFEIVFIARMPAPVTIASVKAEKKADAVNLSWNVANEQNVDSYIVEKSTDGNTFSAIGQVKAARMAQYNFVDAKPVSGNNYYRIVSKDIDGKTGYSAIVKVGLGNAKESVTVSPNPITGNQVNLHVNLQSRGIYYVSIKNHLGQVVENRQIDYSGNPASFSISPATKLVPGVYTLELVNPAGEHSAVRFVK